MNDLATSMTDCSSFKYYRPFSGYLDNNFSLGSKSKTQLLEEYNSLDEVGARHFYFEVLKEIKNSIFSDRLEIFQLLNEILNHLNETLDSELIKTWQQDAHKLNGNLNLIIFACKWASMKIIEYLLSNENNFYKLPFLTGKDDLSPDEEDEECHNAFYYAIRSNVERILQILIEKWPNAYFEENFGRLDDILSKAYDDLILRNVYICKNMEIFVKDKLVDLRFFQEKSSNKTQKMPKGKASNDTQKFKDLVSNRIDFISERIDNIKESFWDSEPDEAFILSAKYIVKNLFTLKSSFVFVNKLPWEEIEFCLIIFIHCCSNHFQKDPLYHFVLNKRRILSYLSHFSKLLKTVKEQIKKANVNKTGKIVIKEIDSIDGNEDFKELYSDFAQVRDLYSIETIRSSIELAISADATTKNGQLVIVRVLQVIGEHFKFSKDSPKLTEATSELLLAAFPGNIKDIITRLRDSLSHSESISMRSEIEKNTPSFFAHLQKDIAKMKVTMIEIRRRTAILIIRTVLDRIVRCGNHSEMKEFVSQNHICEKFLRKELEETNNLMINDMNELEQLISNLEKEIDKELNKSKELFSDVHDIIHGKSVEEPRYYSRLTELFESAIPGDKEGYRSHLLHSYFVTPSSEMAAFAQDLTKVRMNYGKFNQILRGIVLRNQLGTLADANENFVTEEDIGQFTELISVLEKITDEKSRNETAVLQQIQNLIQMEKTRLKEVGRVFNQVISSFLEILLKKGNERTVVATNRFVHQIQSKLAVLTVSLGFKSFSRELNSIANQILLDGEFVREAGVIRALADISNFLQFHMGNIKWIKDFRHMLQSDKKQEPGKNKKSSDLDDDTEIHLKNALKLLENSMCDYHLNELNPAEIENCEKNPEMRFLIEMLVLDVLSVLEYNFLSHDPYFLDSDFPILNGRNLRNHLAHGNVLVSVVLGDDFTNVLLNAKKLLSKKDIFRDKLIGKKTENNPFKSKESLNRYLSVIKQQNSLSVALAKGNIDDVICCIKEGADLCGKSTDLSNSLHFAAKGMNLELIKFLLKFFPNISECDANNQTFLHVAAANGTLNIVEYVLKEKIIYVDSQDIDGKTPLHLASENGHIDVVQYLLEHEAKTTLRTINGLTPLHLAVLENHYDVVLTLLEKEEHVDATQAFYGVTVLHLAAGRGHLKLVEAFIERGADVNFYSDMHLTPLHYAARGGHKDVVEFLIANKSMRQA
ncbi:uncharacterized protein LOC129961598 [Argiope bruennichi]|uniref:uncharacterized protein LOC129961598 n=1 Tax=Argiope bruennichi TaxID=94029 RepID=UPI0024957978|nr:uncharacterized protein LOC129961598 [Argiope bruennichi]